MGWEVHACPTGNALCLFKTSLYIFKLTIFGPGFLPITVGKVDVSRLVEVINWRKFDLQVGDTLTETGGST